MQDFTLLIKENKNLIENIKIDDCEFLNIDAIKTYNVDLGNNYTIDHLENALSKNIEFIQDMGTILELKDDEGFELLGMYDNIFIKYKNNYNQVGELGFSGENIENIINK